MTSMRRTIPIAAALAALCILPATADARGKLKLARYQVTISGTQTATWKLDHTEYDGCVQGDVRQFGEGSDKVTFTSRRRTLVQMLGLGRNDLAVTVGSSGGLPGLPVKGTATRSGHVDTQQLSGGESGCGGGDGSPPPPPDCGAKAYNGYLTLQWTTPDGYPGEPPVPLLPVLIAEGPWTKGGGSVFDSLFQNCPGGTATSLLPTPTSALTARKALGHARSFKLRGRDTEVTDTNGFHQEASVSWTAKFVRVKGRRTLKPPKPPKGAPQCLDGRDNDHDGKTDFPQDKGCSSPVDKSE